MHSVLQSLVSLQIIDISVGLDSKTVKFASPDGLGEFRRMGTTIDEGADYNLSELQDLGVHTATHIDAPSHFVNVRACGSQKPLPCSVWCCLATHACCAGGVQGWEGHRAA